MSTSSIGSDEDNKDDEQQRDPNTWKKFGNVSMAAGTMLDTRNIDDNVYRQDMLQTQDYVANKLEIMKQNQSSVKRTQQLASFVPDFVINDEGQKIPYQMTLEAVAFMADISGFTALTEKYSLKGKGGTDQLTKTLSSYMGPLAECILRAGGDIIKYAGDAFLAIWRVGVAPNYPSTIQLAVDCALYIQQNHGSFDTDVGITIRVKIGIGAGEVHQCGIGNQDFHHFVCFGPGVESASDAEKHCASGEVIMEKAAWDLINPNLFDYTIKDEGFMRIKDIIKFENPEIRGRPMNNKKPIMYAPSANKTFQEIRPNIVRALQTKSEFQLRHYVIPPVLKKMDDDIPLEYLNESRQISIVFIKVEIEKFEANIPFGITTMTIVQQAFKHIYRMGTILQGCLTKIIMFDKGLTYLVVFGLPGYTHDNQSANALKFCYRVKSQLNAIKHVTSASLGVTSGSTYCGVLGHCRRQEYTVIGRKVNKAARLMVYYPGKVTCDQDTLYHSKLPEDQFSLMEVKILKGIENVGNIYEFHGAESGEDQSVRQFHYPMVGRDSELRYFEAILNASEQEFSRFLQAHRLQGDVDFKTRKEVAASGLWMLCFEGDIGIGKSRFLAACIQEAETHGCKIYSVTMSILAGAPRLYAIKSLTTQAFGLTGLRTSQEREEHLRKIVGDDQELSSSLCLLNDFFKLKLPMNVKYAGTDLSSRNVYVQHILSVLIRHCHPESMILFVIDDAHLMDQYSWDYLLHLTRNPSVFALLGIRRNSAGAPKLHEDASKILYHNRNVKTVRLIGLDTKFCLSLACQMMEVAAIPLELQKILTNKSNGIPAWVEQVLSEMLRTGLIKIVPNDPNEFKRRGQRYSQVDPQYITKIVQTAQKRQYGVWNTDDELSRTGSETETEESFDSLLVSNVKISKRVQKEIISPSVRACVVKSDTNIEDTPIPGSLKEILLDVFDELNSNEQMLLKCASVLGLRFSRAMLVRLVPMHERNARKYEFGFRRLMELRIIRCASRNTKTSAEQSTTQPVECYCRMSKEELHIKPSKLNNEVEDDIKLRPKYYSCKFLEFAKDNMVDVVYELMTQDQRKELHLKAAQYLDSSSPKCLICSGEEPAYKFGITLKGNDLATDPDQAIRENRSNSKRSSYRRRTVGRRSTSNRSEASFRSRQESRGKGSFTARMDGLRRVFQNSGTRLGDLELDIIKSLKDFDDKNKLRKKQSGFFSCCFDRQETDGEKEFDLSLTELTHQVNNGEKMSSDNITIGEGDNVEIDRSLTNSNSFSNPPSEGRNSQHNTELDLRGCECPVLIAKIAVEMVKHYRNSEKYGKCLQHLINAAEYAIPIGNSAQALVHLEDAAGLMLEIQKEILPRPQDNDGDDTGIDEEFVNIQIEFLSGFSYSELGVNHKALDFFCRSLKSLGVVVPSEEDRAKRDRAISKASSKLWRRHHCTLFSCSDLTDEKDNKIDIDKISMKIRVLKHLHILFTKEKKSEMALLISLWQVIFAEDFSHSPLDIVPCYCSLMKTYAYLSKHEKAATYEILALNLLRETVGSKAQEEPNGLLTSADLFITVALIRMLRGEIASATDAAYLALRVGQTLHDNPLTIHVLPMVIQSLLLSLRISEVIECLQKLWYISEEDDDWVGVAIYYTLCLDLLLNTAYPMEPFYTCEKFVSSNDWSTKIQLFREYEIQYSLEASLALWYCRYSRWDGAQKWMTQAESHKPKLVTYLSVSAELKLLECELIMVNHYLEAKRYQHFSKSRNSAKLIMRSVKKSTKLVPVFEPRFLHLMGYYCQIRSRSSEAEKYLKKAEKMAYLHENNLEMEWIAHNRMVWADVAIPTLKFFWLEHTESHTLDWHQSGKVPWANIMYSLPLPTWK